jgi:hypothetical protein
MWDNYSKIAGDVIAVTAAAGALLNALPPVAAAVALIYTLIRIYETHTFQRLLARLLGRPQPKAPWQSDD